MDTHVAHSGSLHPLSRLAFYDELEKISAAKAGEGKVGKWLKNTAIVSAGAGLGTAAYSAGHRALKKHGGPGWNRLSNARKAAILGPAAVAAGLTSAHLARKLLKKKREADA